MARRVARRRACWAGSSSRCASIVGSCLLTSIVWTGRRTTHEIRGGAGGLRSGRGVSGTNGRIVVLTAGCPRFRGWYTVKIPNRPLIVVRKRFTGSDRVFALDTNMATDFLCSIGTESCTSGVFCIYVASEVWHTSMLYPRTCNSSERLCFLTSNLFYAIVDG